MRMPNITCCIREFAERSPCSGTAERIATPWAGPKKLETTLMAGEDRTGSRTGFEQQQAKARAEKI